MAKRLRIWWVPQVPMKPFTVDVDSVQEGVRLMNVLADYDKFEVENYIKPDYCNMGGLSILEEGEWCRWYDEETGEDDPRKYLKQTQS